MGQTRRQSAIESVANIAVGYGVAVGAQYAIFPVFGIHIPASDNLLIGALFTVVSLVRSYVLRRVFNSFSVIQDKSQQSNASVFIREGPCDT